MGYGHKPCLVLSLQYVPLGPTVRGPRTGKADSAPFKPPHSGSSGILGKPFEYMPCPALKQVTVTSPRLSWGAVRTMHVMLIAVADQFNLLLLLTSRCLHQWRLCDSPRAATILALEPLDVLNLEPTAAHKADVWLSPLQVRDKHAEGAAWKPNFDHRTGATPSVMRTNLHAIPR